MRFYRQMTSQRCGPSGLARPGMFWLGLVCALGFPVVPATQAGELTVVLENGQNVVRVGAFNRWDRDGNRRVPVDPKAKIDAPRCAATATQVRPGRWIFSKLPPDTYDLVILRRDRVRIEGFHYPPVLEFDEFLKHDGQVTAEIKERIEADIAQSRHYENKVTPLYMSGSDEFVRVFVQLLRDKPTSYDAQYGEPVATLRHEVWQFTNNYGGWVKEKRTRVFDRVLTGKAELRQWTWVWVPKLGGIEVEQDDTVLRYSIPKQWNPERGRGLLPY